MLENVVDILEDCRFCLMCRHLAPTGLVTRQETLTPHGIALIVTSQRRGLTEWNAETAGIVYSECDGGNSRAHCVNDRPFEAAVAAVRAELASSNLAPSQVYEVADRLREWGSPYAESPVEAQTTQGSTAFYVGDEAPALWQGTMPAVLQLLGALGVTPALIGRGRSSGFLAQSLGFPELAQRQALITLEELQATGAQRLLVLSPGDHFTFSRMYEERLGLAWPAIELVEMTSLLADKLSAGAITFAQSSDQTPYAYVDPTHAVRVPDRHEHPRTLLRAVMPTSPRELFWHHDRAQPVGSTHLQFSDPQLADRLTHARLADAGESGVELLICDDPATLYQLNRFAPEYGLAVRGLYELLAEHIAN